MTFTHGQAGLYIAPGNSFKRQQARRLAEWGRRAKAADQPQGPGLAGVFGVITLRHGVVPWRMRSAKTTVLALFHRPARVSNRCDLNPKSCPGARQKRICLACSRIPIPSVPFWCFWLLDTTSVLPPPPGWWAKCFNHWAGGRLPGQTSAELAAHFCTLARH